MLAEILEFVRSQKVRIVNQYLDLGGRGSYPIAPIDSRSAPFGGVAPIGDLVTPSGLKVTGSVFNPDDAAKAGFYIEPGTESETKGKG